MLFKVFNNYTYIKYESEEEEKVLRFLADSYKIEFHQYYRHIGGNSGGFQPASISLLRFSESKKQGKYFFILTGLIDELVALLSDYNIIPKITRTINFLSLSQLRLTETLRDYQFDIVADIVQRTRAVVKAPVGAGKTLCMAAILSLFAEHKAIIIAPGKDLREQLTKNLMQLIPDYRIVTVAQCGYSADFPGNAIIDLPLNLAKLPQGILAACPLLIMDEAHGAPAQKTMEFIKAHNAPYRFGFTATPEGRSDHKDKIIIGLFGNIVDGVNFTELRDRGFVPDMKVKMYYCGWNDDYNYVEDMLIVNNPRRNQLIHTLVRDHLTHNKNGLVLVMSRKLAHIDLLVQQYFPDALVLTGESLDRQEKIDEIKQGKYQIVLASNIFSQGINIPQFTLGVNASGGKSTIVAEQKAGRMVRGNGVKQWIDIYDNYTNILERHSLARANTYNQAFDNLSFVDFPERYDINSKLE